MPASGRVAYEEATKRVLWCAICQGRRIRTGQARARIPSATRDQVSAQTWELNLLQARFARYETALRGSQVTVYTQTAIFVTPRSAIPMLGRSSEEILGHTDLEILPSGQQCRDNRRKTRSAQERRGQADRGARSKMRLGFAGMVCTSSRFETTRR